MNKHIFINLPVADLGRAISFYKALGYPDNPQFAGESNGCIAISDGISVMLLSYARFKDFTPKAVCDTSQAVEMLLCLTCDSRAEVDTLVARALAAGGSTYDEPEDDGFMYSHSFVDPDGHGWGLVYMAGTPGEAQAAG